MQSLTGTPFLPGGCKQQDEGGRRNGRVGSKKRNALNCSWQRRSQKAKTPISPSFPLYLEKSPTLSFPPLFLVHRRINTFSFPSSTPFALRYCQPSYRTDESAPAAIMARDRKEGRKRNSHKTAIFALEPSSSLEREGGGGDFIPSGWILVPIFPLLLLRLL